MYKAPLHGRYVKPLNGDFVKHPPVSVGKRPKSPLRGLHAGSYVSVGIRLKSSYVCMKPLGDLQSPSVWGLCEAFPSTCSKKTIMYICL